MIPSSHFIHVIQAERERDLERWQLVRAAYNSEQRRPAPSLVGRVRSTLGSWSLGIRPGAARVSMTERTPGSVACC